MIKKEIKLAIIKVISIKNIKNKSEEVISFANSNSVNTKFITPMITLYEHNDMIIGNLRDFNMLEKLTGEPFEIQPKRKTKYNKLFKDVEIALVMDKEIFKNYTIKNGGKRIWYQNNK